MMLSIIVAASQDNAIGRNGQLLWHLPNDMQFFKNTTWAMPVIMGRKTFESLGKPLQGRTNIVITRDPDWKADGTTVVSSLDEAIEAANQLLVKEAFVIGGGQVYTEALEIAKRIYITRVMGFFADADTHFPAVDWQQWKMMRDQHFKADEKNRYDHRIQIWERKFG
jgi:dihydrofolate reductase